ncbi:MAG: metallophosphoesterase, partial [Nanoarchaeota archaeon]
MKPYLPWPRKDVTFYDVACYLPKTRTAIIGDLQIGNEEALNTRGVLIPRTQLAELQKTIDRILALKPKEVVINGDLKHEFGRISPTEWRGVLAIIDQIQKRCALIIVRGNHDPMAEPILRKRGLTVKEYVVRSGYYICHGHVEPQGAAIKKTKCIIIGHEHP